MASRVEEGDIVILEDPAKLRTLASLLLRQEEALLATMTTESERVKYLQNCNESYDGVIKLIDGTSDLRNKNKDSNNKQVVKIVEDIHKYITYGINMSMQCIRNCSLRVRCIGKIQAHFNDLVKVVGELHPHDVAGAEQLAKEVALYKEYMWEYTSKCRSGSARALSKMFSKVIKEEGMHFPDLVERHKNKLQFKGEFEELEMAQQKKVYNSIIEESGRAKIPKMELASASLGMAVLVTAAALVVFDIYEAENKLEAIVRNTLNAASEVGAFTVQLAVEGAVSATMAEMELGGVLVVAASGFIAGALAGLIFVAASGALIDLIFESGGKVHPHMIGMQFRKLIVPDGMALAYELAHDH